MTKPMGGLLTKHTLVAPVSCGELGWGHPGGGEALLSWGVEGHQACAWCMGWVREWTATVPRPACLSGDSSSAEPDRGCVGGRRILVTLTSTGISQTHTPGRASGGCCSWGASAPWGGGRSSLCCGLLGTSPQICQGCRVRSWRREGSTHLIARMRWDPKGDLPLGARSPGREAPPSMRMLGGLLPCLAPASVKHPEPPSRAGSPTPG